MLVLLSKIPLVKPIKSYQQKLQIKLKLAFIFKTLEYALCQQTDNRIKTKDTFLIKPKALNVYC